MEHIWPIPGFPNTQEYQFLSNGPIYHSMIPDVLTHNPYVGPESVLMRFPPLNADIHTRVACILLNELQRPAFRPHPDQNPRYFDTSQRKCNHFVRCWPSPVMNPYGLMLPGLCEIFISVYTNYIEVNGTKEYWLEARAECLDFAGDIIPLKLGGYSHDKVQIILSWDHKQRRGPITSYYDSFEDMPWNEIMRLIHWRAACQYDNYGKLRTLEETQQVVRAFFRGPFP